jgi:hypothetical protein
MSASRLVGLGMLVVFVDLRFDGFDFVVDLVGWVLAYVGLRNLYKLDRAFRPATGFAGLGAIVSLTQLIPSDGELAGWLGAAVETVAWAGVVICSCTGLMRIAEGVGDRRFAARVGWLRSAAFVAVVMALTIGWGADAAGGLGAVAFLAVAVGFGTALWFVLLMLLPIRLTTDRSEATT